MRKVELTICSSKHFKKEGAIILEKQVRDFHTID